MTAWLALVIPLSVTAKCSVDFIVLEYGSKFRLISDSSFTSLCLLLCLYALLVDFFNAVRWFQTKDNRR